MTHSTNRLLSALSGADRALLTPHLEPVGLAFKQPIDRPNEAIQHIYFPSSGIISTVAQSPGGNMIEAGVVGREGMTGLAVVMGDDRTPNDVYVQVAGAAHRISADHLRVAIGASRSLQALLLRFAQALLVQISQTALANGRVNIDARLARWLLMARDRLDSDEVALTHEFMALMLGVRRPGVTDALHELEGKGLIDSTRGSMRLTNRPGLETLAGGAYGVPESEYFRLIGVRLRESLGAGAGILQT